MVLYNIVSNGRFGEGWWLGGKDELAYEYPGHTVSGRIPSGLRRCRRHAGGMVFNLRAQINGVALIIYAFLMDYYITGLTAGATKG